MKPTPYLFFNGQCAEAFAAYAEILDGTIEFMAPSSEMPPEYDVPDDRKDWIMHAAMRIGDGALMASDDITGTADKMAGCSVMLSFPALDRAANVFEALAEGGEIGMPFAPTFWSAGFGVLTDRFGIRWMIGCDAPPEE